MIHILATEHPLLGSIGGGEVSYFDIREKNCSSPHRQPHIFIAVGAGRQVVGSLNWHDRRRHITFLLVEKCPGHPFRSDLNMHCLLMRQEFEPFSSTPRLMLAMTHGRVSWQRTVVNAWELEFASSPKTWMHSIARLGKPKVFALLCAMFPEAQLPLRDSNPQGVAPDSHPGNGTFAPLVAVK